MNIPENTLMLQKWSETTGPFEHTVWVGKEISVADVKRAVKALFEHGLKV